MQNSQNDFYAWTDRKLKGTIAETIVQQLLEYSGYSVFRFGQETFLQNLRSLKLKENFIRKLIKSLPDFIVIDKDGNANLLEVKYRTNTINPEKDEKLQHLGETWGESRIIFVSINKPHFRISRIKDFLKTGKLYSLEEDKFIKIDKNLLKRYENLVIRYYEGK